MMFDPFGDAKSRGYLRNIAGETNRGRVKVLEHQSFAQHAVTALENLAMQSTLSYQDLLKTHEILFQSVYPWAGQDRAALARQFAIDPGAHFGMFAPPAGIQRAAEYALNIARDTKAMRSKPGRTYGLIARAHPFLDGNGRTVMVVYADLTRRAGFNIDWSAIPKLAFLKALEEELRTPAGALDRLFQLYIYSVQRKPPVYSDRIPP